MSRIVGSDAEAAIGDLRRRFVPLLSTVAAILLGAMLPVVAASPWLPNPGFLMLITWRLVRPEIWSAQAALGFGFAADVITGAPLGQSMLLWTAIFLGLESLDAWLGVRDYWLDWAAAAVAIFVHSLGVWYIALLIGADTHFSIMIPQIILTILTYPVVARIVLGLDRWRLAR